MARLAAIAAVLISIAARTHAQSLPLELTWTAPPECAAASEVRAELERVARVRPGVQLTPLVARAQVTHAGAGYALELHTEHDGERGERRFDAADCSTLVRSLTLVLALAFGTGVEVGVDVADAVDPAGGAAKPDETPEGSQNRTDAPTAVATQSDEPEPSPARGRGSLRGSLLFGAGAQLGVLPAAAFAVSVGGELAGERWSLALRVTGWPGVTSHVAGDVDARFDGAGATLAACLLLPAGDLGAAACGGGRMAALRGRARHSAEDRSAVAPWPALVAGAALAWPRTAPLQLRLEGRLVMSLDRPEFVVEDVARAHRLPLLGGELDLALALAL